MVLQRYFRSLENDLHEPKILDQPFLKAADAAVDEISRELTTYALTDRSPGEIAAAMLEQVPPLETLQAYIDKNHIEHCKSGGTLPLKLPDVAVDMANQLAIDPG